MEQNYFEECLHFKTKEGEVVFRASFTIVRDQDNNVLRVIVILSDKIFNDKKIAAVA